MRVKKGSQRFKSVSRFITVVLLVSALPMAEAPARPDESRPSVRQLLLDNGLQLVWEEDHRQPLVAIEARIKGGLRGEGPFAGTGITHFIEHMLFKGTPSRPPGTIDQEVRRYGGTINAFTSFDATGVSLFVESRYLPEALGMLADILQHAIFDQTEFEKERAVIVSEIQMNLDDPDRRLSHLFWSRHYLEHPYRHPILGYQSLLERLTTADLTEFYAAQYQPQNVVISCVGDLDPQTFPAAAREIFEAWPRGRVDPRQQVVAPEPPAASAKEAVAELPVQTGYVLVGFGSVRLSDPELYPLDVLANIIGDGRSSRLYETLVRKEQLADAVTAWNYTPFDPGIFAVQMRADPDRIAAATAAALRILEDVKRRGVTEAELRKAKKRVSADYLLNLQTVESRAGDLVNSLLATGDPLFSRRYVEGIEAVSVRQVQDAALRYCDAAKMTTAVIRPPAAAAQAGASPIRGPMAVSKMTLKNGATVMTGLDHTLPIAAMVVAFRGGVRVETEETQGLSNLVAQLLTKGTKRKNASEIALQVESLGGRLEPFSGRDGFGMVLQLLSEDVPEGMALLHELVTQSVFPEEELNLQRQLIAKQLAAEDDEIFDVGGRLLRRTLFGRHPYRFDPLGDRDTIGRLSRAACQEFAARWLVPSNMVLAIFGDVTPQAVARQAGQTFGALPSEQAPWPDQLDVDLPSDIRAAAQTMAKEQSLVMLGFPGITYGAPDRYALEVMTAVLSGMSGRLFQAVREAHGLSYTLGAVNVAGWDPGYLVIYAATRPNEQDRVLELLDSELRSVIDEGFTEEEVAQARQFLIGAHRLDVQHVAGLAKRVALDELYGMGFDAWTEYEARINHVTVPLVHGAAKRYLTLQQRAQVVISPDGHATTSP